MMVYVGESEGYYGDSSITRLMSTERVQSEHVLVGRMPCSIPIDPC